MVSLEAPTSCQHSAFRWKSMVEMISKPSFLSVSERRFWEMAITGYFGFPCFFQMYLSTSKSVVSFCKTKVIIFEAPLSACFFPRLGNACDVEGRCKIVNLPLFCQRCTNMIANRLNLCFTAPPLPGFLILVISYDRENRCLLQYRLSLGLIGTFHIGWGSIQFFIFFSCWIVTSPKCRNFIK